MISSLMIPFNSCMFGRSRPGRGIKRVYEWGEVVYQDTNQLKYTSGLRKPTASPTRGTDSDYGLRGAVSEIRIVIPA
jgi:hypothetical protein